MPSIVYLVGPPASGKRTIAEALSRLTGAALIDNHLINDPIFRAYGADGSSPLPDWVWGLALQVRIATMTALAHARPQVSHVVTNYLSNKRSEQQYIDELREIAARRSARFVPVWLTCTESELLRRVSLPSRRVHHKLTDPAALRDLLDTKGVFSPPSDALVLDTTSIEPDDAAREIHAKIPLFRVV